MQNCSADNVNVLDDVFARARAFESGLLVCLKLGEEALMREMCVGLAREIARATAIARAASKLDVALYAARLDMVATATQGMRTLLAQAAIEMAPPHYARVERAGFQSTVEDVAVPALHGIDARGSSLRDVELFGLHILRARWITDLRGASLQNVKLEDGDFTFSDFNNTVWAQVHAERCSFRDCTFRDVAMVDTTFIRCDMKNTRFSVSQRTLAAPWLVFVGCDLRGAEIDSYVRAIAIFVDCEMDETCVVQESELHGPSPVSLLPTGDAAREDFASCSE